MFLSFRYSWCETHVVVTWVKLEMMEPPLQKLGVHLENVFQATQGCHGSGIKCFRHWSTDNFGLMTDIGTNEPGKWMNCSAIYFRCSIFSLHLFEVVNMDLFYNFCANIKSVSTCHFILKPYFRCPVNTICFYESKNCYYFIDNFIVSSSTVLDYSDLTVPSLCYANKATCLVQILYIDGRKESILSDINGL